MGTVTRYRTVLISLLVLLTLLTLLAIKRRDLTVEEAQYGAVREGFKLGDTVLRVRDEHAVTAFVCLAGLCVFVLWTALNARAGVDDSPAAGQGVEETERHNNLPAT